MGLTIAGQGVAIRAIAALGSLVGAAVVLGLLWASFVDRRLDGGDYGLIAWQTLPFALAAAFLLSERVEAVAFAAFVTAAAIMALAYVAAYASTDPFGFVFVLIAPIVALIAVSAVLGFGGLDDGGWQERPFS